MATKATQKTVKHRNVIPLYAVCGVWLVGTFAFHLTGGVGVMVMVILSLVTYGIACLIAPSWTETVTEEPKKDEVKKNDPKFSEVSSMEQERNKALADIRSLNDRIQDPVISGKIYRIETSTGHIYSAVMDKPEKKNEVRTFFNYYLPTTLKLLNEYHRIDSMGVSGENIDATKRRIEEMLDTICTAFEKQVDLLYSDEAMDIKSDIAVLNSMMQQQGLQ